MVHKPFSLWQDLISYFAIALDLEGVFRISVAFPDLLEMKEMLESGACPMCGYADIMIPC